MKEIVKKVLKSSLIGRKIYPMLQYIYRLYAVPIKRRRLRMFGPEMLLKLHGLLTSNNINYHLDFGSLLGVVRENDFIKHDDDIDLTIIGKSSDPCKILKLLMDNGFEFIHAMKVRDRIVEFSVSYRKLSADFFFYLPVEKQGKVGICGVYFNPDFQYPTSDLNHYRVWYFPDNVKSKIVTFKGTDVCIPENAEALLEFEYGKGWRSPIKNWVADNMEERFEIMDDFAIRITDVKKVFE